jgi:hypothetical protein
VLVFLYSKNALKIFQGTLIKCSQNFSGHFDRMP